MQNLNLTWAQDLGSVTELLSGAFYQPLGRSSSHQMWSSAMVITPLIRGLFGLSWDAQNKTLYIDPHFPPEWTQARLQHVHAGSGSVDLAFNRTADGLRTRAQASTPITICPVHSACKTSEQTFLIPLPPIELGIRAVLPGQGDKTRQLKVLAAERSETQAAFTFAAQARSEYDLPIRQNRPGVRVTGAEIRGDKLHLTFADGTGYQKLVGTFAW